MPGLPVYIGLGSNLEDPSRQIRQALEQLNKLPQSRLCSLSRVYQSSPLGPENQPDYLNAVALISTSLPPEKLLTCLQSIEQRQHRVRTVHWGPRTIDLDILLFGNKQIHTDRLTIPHPQMYQRNFVLIPMFDINPDLTLPNGKPLRDLVNESDRKGLKPIGEPYEYLGNL